MKATLVEHPRGAEVQDDRGADARQQLDAREVGPREPDRGHVGLAVLLVDAPEEVLGRLLAPEALHHADPREGLLQGREHVGDALAGAPVGACGVDAKERGADRERREDHERQQRQLDVVGEEDHDHPDEREAVDHERGDAVGDQLLQRLDVAGEAAHRATGGGALVVTDLEAHQVPEGVGAQVEQHALADPAREEGLVVAGKPAHQAGHDEEPHGEQQGPLVARGDAVVDRELGERRDGQAARGDDQHEGDRRRRAARVGPEVGQ